MNVVDADVILEEGNGVYGELLVYEDDVLIMSVCLCTRWRMHE